MNRSVRRSWYFALVGVCVLLTALARGATGPAWWTNRNVISVGATTNDFALANAGQVKWIASNACAELNAILPAGAGTAIVAFVSGFSSTNNYKAVNSGQLKNIARVFYDRLIAESYASSCPWTTNTADDSDYSAVNIGQVKEIFRFGTDDDGDAMADWWEMDWFGNLTNSAAGDFDGDGLTNLGEYQWNSNPTNTDSDADAINDGTEVANRTDPTNSDTSIPSIVILAPANNSKWMIVP